MQYSNLEEQAIIMSRRNTLWQIILSSNSFTVICILLPSSGYNQTYCIYNQIWTFGWRTDPDQDNSNTSREEAL